MQGFISLAFFCVYILTKISIISSSTKYCRAKTVKICQFSPINNYFRAKTVKNLQFPPRNNPTPTQKKLNLSPFLLQQLPFFINHLAGSFPVETADIAVACYHPVTRNVRRKGIPLQGLTNGLRTPATNPEPQFLIRDSLTARHIKKFQINLALKLGDIFGGKHYFSDIHFVYNLSINSSTSFSSVAQLHTNLTVVSFSPRGPQSSKEADCFRRSITSLGRTKNC